jgi:hypothetical protein
VVPVCDVCVFAVTQVRAQNALSHPHEVAPLILHHRQRIFVVVDEQQALHFHLGSKIQRRISLFRITFTEEQVGFRFIDHSLTDQLTAFLLKRLAAVEMDRFHHVRQFGRDVSVIAGLCVEVADVVDNEEMQADALVFDQSVFEPVVNIRTKNILEVFAPSNERDPDIQWHSDIIASVCRPFASLLFICN